MDSLLLRRAALLQAKLKVLEEHKNAFTDHVEILAFHRLKKQFDGLIGSHKNLLTADPLASIKEDFEKDKTFVIQLHQIAREAEGRLTTVASKHQIYLTTEY